jgi:3-deoxy-7-phosphoheptulonate synthase
MIHTLENTITPTHFTAHTMIIVMQRFAPKEDMEHVIREIESHEGLRAIPLHGTERTVIAVIGDERKMDEHHVRSLPGVGSVMAVLQPYKLASRETKHESTVVKVKRAVIGGNEVALMAGPCAVETEEQTRLSAICANKAGAKILRGGAFKPRTNPYAFEGLKEEGLKILRKVADEFDMAVVTEVMDLRTIDIVEKYADILQIGTRNMQNFDLLKEVGKSKKPVLLKRGMSATIKEFLLAAEYILSNGNPNVILCERGIRTFETETRNTLALDAIPLIKEMSHLPIIVDPSHAAGKKKLISPLSKAAIACGADGLIIDIHPYPEKALCDGDQALLPEEFLKIIEELRPIAKAVGRTFAEV